MSKICLIVPCYNEENRINLEEYLNYKDIVFIFVNDGSQDNTYVKLTNYFLSTQNYVFNLRENVGKAEAVRQGVFFAKSLDIYDSFEWIGFWDADLVTPLYEVKNFILYKDLVCKNCDAIFGSRIKRLGSKVERKFLRNIFGKFFISVVRFVFKVNVYDSQCGAKLFSKNIIDVVFNDAFISKWIFDVEILMRIENMKVIEYPLLEWNEMVIPNSKMKIFNEIFRIFNDLLKIYKKYRLKP